MMPKSLIQKLKKLMRSKRKARRTFLNHVDAARDALRTTTAHDAIVARRNITYLDHTELR